jgi:hypothetical protein
MKYCLLLFVSSFAATTVMAAEAPTPGTGGHLAPASSLVKAPASRNERIQVSSEGASLVRDGESSPLRKGVTLTDGTSVAPNGDIIRADGSPLRLRAGEWLDLDGQVCSPEHAPAPARVTSPAGMVSSRGTESVSQAAADLGEAEAKRRTDAAISEAISAAPNNSAK